MRSDVSARVLSSPGSKPLLRLQLREEGPVDVAIFDAGGRRVRNLFAGGLPAGEHDLTWDGRDDVGAAAEAGVYFAKISARERVRSVALVIIR
jgi:flagellar hook assembly protein FlgD